MEPPTVGSAALAATPARRAEEKKKRALF